MPIYEIKENLLIGLKNYFHYWQNYVTSGSGIAGCDCMYICKGFLATFSDNALVVIVLIISVFLIFVIITIIVRAVFWEERNL